MPLNELHFKLTERQTQAWQYLTDDYNREVLFGGAKGGGKTHLLCLWVGYWAMWLADFWELPRSDKPPAVGWMGRKIGVNFEDTTWETFIRVWPSSVYKLREKAKEIIFDGRVKIAYGGLDDQEVIEKFNSAEYAFIALDQAEETEKREVATLEGSRRLRLRGKTPPYKTFFTANPREGWLKEEFYLKTRKSGIFIPALPRDNPHLPANYEETLRTAYSHDEDRLRAYLEGDWSVRSTDKILIASDWLENLVGRSTIHAKHIRVISCDPAAGGDEVVIYVMEDGDIIDEKISTENDETRIAANIVDFARIFNVPHNCIGIDTIGVGHGVANIVKRMYRRPYFINSSESSTSVICINRRSEMWWTARAMVLERRVGYPKDAELRRQITAQRFTLVGSPERVKVEKKELTKKRLGNSPDRADAWVYGLWMTHLITTSPHLSVTAEHGYDDRYRPVEYREAPSREFSRDSGRIKEALLA